MARSSRITTLGSLEGKLGSIRQEVQQLLQGLKREIAKREAELAALKAEYSRGAGLLQAGPKPPAVPARRTRKARRARPIDWQKVLGTLPARFTLKELSAHPVAGKRPKSHLYSIVSRWKKDRKLAAAPGGGYRKLEPKPSKPAAKPRKPRPKSAPAAKPATPPAEPTA
jgi:hypothetical protein